MSGSWHFRRDPEFVGVMPVRQEVEILPADEPRRLNLGWIVQEIVGIGIVNPRSVATATRRNPDRERLWDNLDEDLQWLWPGPRNDVEPALPPSDPELEFFGESLS